MRTLDLNKLSDNTIYIKAKDKLKFKSILEKHKIKCLEYKIYNNTGCR